MFANKVSQMFEKGVRGITNALTAVAMGVAFLLMLLGTGDVIGRYLFRQPIPAAAGFSEVMLVALVYFGVAYALTVGGHVSIDSIVTRLPSRWQQIIGVITSFAALVIFSLLTWQSALKAIRTWEAHETVDITNIPVAPSSSLSR